MNYNQLKVLVKNVTVLVEVKVQEMVKLLDAEAKDKKLVQAVALD
jgi:hypothetical protein